MLSKPACGDEFLTYLDALDEEDRALGGEPDFEFERLRIAYADARAKRNAVCEIPSEPEAQKNAEALVEEAEKEFRTNLFKRLHSRERSALCFSGGGIRSATFGLGILQGLAACSAKPANGRPKLLGEFDYLSTVSGGGYLGGVVFGLGRPAGQSRPRQV